MVRVSHATAQSREVHADASNFTQSVTKADAYEQILLQAEGLFTGQRNWYKSGVGRTNLARGSNLANAASLLWHAYKSLPAPMQDVNWAGFYVSDPTSPKPRLILGPFQGKVACQTIDFGRGVCGTAAATQETQLVADVDKFPGHIACDSDSRSEIVVPILAEKDGRGAKEVVAIIDVDCASLLGFDDLDRTYLEKLAELLARSCDW
ncbi:GAF domain nucleotide-binding protein [Drechmeria coniospora]|uniref:GAF domain nucleotide-binding protein n=1 Tax=Drechmeria coniospora TaxID=98403 RepID=A0A151GT92_DRECN|nr:GAF domain nucleotide-binding protein [Drechmeria coniospora]KYK60344.1 GAF domain nucleotide-binding protein [Drechmeria coniospora]